MTGHVVKVMESCEHSKKCLRAIILTVTVCGYATAGSSVSHLIREVLLKNYDPDVYPVRNPADPVHISVSMGIKTFLELDTKKQRLTSFGWLVVSWHDSFLAWDTSQYPVKKIHVPPDKVWRPEMVVLNSLGDFDRLISQQLHLTVQNDGRVWWVPGGLFETFCIVDVSKYPLDTQTCSVEFVPWGASNDAINCSFADPSVDVHYMKQHPEWTFVRADTALYRSPDNHTVLSFMYTLKRKALRHILFLVVPTVLLSVINCLVFLLPPDCGEKITLSVTSLVSIVVFMTIVSGSLPENSDRVSFFSVYVSLQMVLSVICTVMSTIIVSIFGKDWHQSFTIPSVDRRNTEHRRKSESPFLNRRLSFAAGIPYYLGGQRRFTIADLETVDSHDGSGVISSEADAHVTNQRSFSFEMPRHVAERPGHIAERPGHIAERLGHIAEISGHIAERPGYIAERPGHIAEKPEHRAERPRHRAWRIRSCPTAAHLPARCRCRCTCAGGRRAADATRSHEATYTECRGNCTFHSSVCSNWITAKRLLTKKGKLTSCERALLAQVLDKICFVISVHVTLLLLAVLTVMMNI